ncbi:MAG: MjaI family restriction endonuclease [Nitrospirae bacterium]|nr:MjaI family restriction endonuclease [Nitrospirota bacterium]
MKIKLTNEAIRKSLEIPKPEFPKYVTQIINLANQNAQGTRPKVVGQLTDLIQEFTGRTLEEWEQWYLQRHPDSIEKAKEKILAMLDNLKASMNQIDANMVDVWAHDLVIVQTFLGLKFQEAILKKAAEIKGVEYRLSEKTDESRGIDAYLGDMPVSIKPETYKIKKTLSESINVKMIYYRKIKNGIEVDYNEIL